MTTSTYNSRFSFEILLSSMVLLLFIPSLFSGYLGNLFSRTLLTAILLACLYLVAHSRRDLTIGIVLAIPAMVTNWLPGDLIGITSQMLIYALFKIAFLVYIIFKILNYLVRARRVNSEVISAAICLYMIIGLTWMFIYFSIVSIDPNAINLSADPAYTDRQTASVLINELLYFSYVTQTTLGYGDLSPVTGIARAFAMVQALVGQIYIAVVVARLVGLEIVHASSDK